jgi:hypothetical protein
MTLATVALAAMVTLGCHQPSEKCPPAVASASPVVSALAATKAATRDTQARAAEAQLAALRSICSHDTGHHGVLHAIRSGEFTWANCWTGDCSQGGCYEDREIWSRKIWTPTEESK